MEKRSERESVPRKKPDSIIPKGLKKEGTVGDALAVWDDWCTRFVSLPQVPLSVDHAVAFAFLTIQELSKAPVGEAVEKTFYYQIMERRLRLFNVKATPQVKSFVLCLCSCPGDVVMYTHILTWMYMKTGAEVSLDTLVETFQEGFPSEDSMSDIWYMQKNPVEAPEVMDNFLDQLKPDMISAYQDWVASKEPPKA